MNYLGRKLCPPKKKRKPIRKVGRVGGKRQQGKKLAKLHYAYTHEPRCQSCAGYLTPSQFDAHHKLKCSQGGGEGFENMLIVCRCCHLFIHQPGFFDRIRHVLMQDVNVDNGKLIDWAHHKESLIKWRLAFR